MLIFIEFTKISKNLQPLTLKTVIQIKGSWPTLMRINNPFVLEVENVFYLELFERFVLEVENVFYLELFERFTWNITWCFLEYDQRYGCKKK